MNTNSSKLPTVAILMATYNGEKYLAEQLESFISQSYKNWVVWASDDGSSDATIKIISEYQKKLPPGRINFIQGPKQGFAKNFLSMVCNEQIQADAFAYSDQDDIWMDDKLERAVKWLESVSANLPALYCSRTEYVDEDNGHIGFSGAYARPAVFANALVQNIASGNTMVFNLAARNLLKEVGDSVSIPLHDWWTYMLVAGCEGAVFFDHTPTVRYRQHQNNLWGMNEGWKARYARIEKLFEGRFKGWNERHVVALKNFYNKIAPANQAIYENFVRARVSRLPNRIYYLKKSRVYRQTFLGNLGLLAATIFAKL